VIDFKIKGEEAEKLQAKFIFRLKSILDEQQIQYEDKVLIKVVKRYYPDWRRLINECQRFSATGTISSAVLVDVADITIDDLLRSLKNKEFTNVKKWVAENIDNDPSIVMRRIYDVLYDNLKAVSIPEAVLIIAKYQYQISFVADQEINLLACLTEIMMSCEFK
jgi:replication factor C small subunit